MRSSTPKYSMVSSITELRRVLAKCAATTTALDFETTSLSPSEGRVRLVSLCNDKVHALVDFDKIKGGFKATAKLFNNGEWVVFNKGLSLSPFLYLSHFSSPVVGVQQPPVSTPISPAPNLKTFHSDLAYGNKPPALLSLFLLQ